MRSPARSALDSPGFESAPDRRPGASLPDRRARVLALLPRTVWRPRPSGGGRTRRTARARCAPSSSRAMASCPPRFRRYPAAAKHRPHRAWRIAWRDASRTCARSLLENETTIRAASGSRTRPYARSTSDNTCRSVVCTASLGIALPSASSSRADHLTIFSAGVTARFDQRRHRAIAPSASSCSWVSTRKNAVAHVHVDQAAHGPRPCRSARAIRLSASTEAKLHQSLDLGSACSMVIASSRAS